MTAFIIFFFLFYFLWGMLRMQHCILYHDHSYGGCIDVLVVTDRFSGVARGAPKSCQRFFENLYKEKF